MNTKHKIQPVVFEKFAEVAVHGFVMTTVDGVAEYVNPALCKIFEIVPEDVIGKSFISFYSSEMQQKIKQEVIPSLMKEGAWQGELIVTTKNGKQINTSESYSVIYDEQDKPLYIIDVLVDISESKRLQLNELMHTAKIEKERSEAKLSHFIKFLPIPLAKVDNTTGKMEYINKNFQKTFGYTLEDVPTLQAWWEKAYPDVTYRKLVLANWGKAVKDAKENDSEIRSDIYNVTCKNGSERKIIIGGVALDNEFLATFLDATKQKKAEEKNKKLMYNLSERLKEMTTLYEIEAIESNSDFTIDEALQKIVTSLPSGLQYPDQTASLINCEGKIFKNSNDIESEFYIESPIIINHEKIGFVKVMFIASDTIKSSNPFLIEEQKLIDTIANIIAKMIQRRIVEEKYRKLFISMNEGYALNEVILDKHGKPKDYRFLEINPAFEKYTGLKASVVVGKSLCEVFPGIEDDPIDLIGKYGNVVLTGEDLVFDQFSEALNRWFKIHAFRHEEGQFAVTFTDITVQKKHEQAMLKEKTVTESVLDSIPGIFYQIDTNGKFVRTNKNFQELVGKTTEEMKEVHAIDLFVGDEKIKIEVAMKQVFTEGQSEIEAKLHTTDRDIPYYFSGVLKKIDGIPYLLGVGGDITTIKQAEKNLLEKNKELEVFNKMAIGREKRMIELKRKINILSRDLNLEEPFDMSFADSDSV
jgi:PAS domain S-box-containing protein